jgi:fumarate reductase flavoprotein subunit
MAAWLVWDQQIYDKAPPLFAALSKDQQQKAFESHPMFAKSDTLRELAEKMKVPAAALAKTVRAYNQSVVSKSDTLGRTHMPLPIEIGPFYAVECLGSAIFGHAGIDIDGDMRVVTKEGHPIPGLYAVGEVAGGWQTHGDAVVNGGTVTPAVALGRYLGLTLPIKA